MLESDLFLFMLGQVVGCASQKMNDKGNTDQSRDRVGDGLGDLHARQSPEMDGDEKRGDQCRARAQDRQKGRYARASDALIEHIHGDGEGKKEQSDRRVAERGCADADDRLAFLEDVNDLIRQQKSARGEDQHDDKSKHGGEDQPLLHALVLLRAVVEGRHGLKALTDAETDAHHER